MADKAIQDYNAANMAQRSAFLYLVANTTAGEYQKVTDAQLTGFAGSFAASTMVYSNASSLLASDTAWRYNGSTSAIGGASLNASIRQLVRGIGTTSATWGLRLEDSAGTQTWGFRDDGVITKAGTYALNVTTGLTIIGNHTLTSTTSLYAGSIGNSNTLNLSDSSLVAIQYGRSLSTTQASGSGTTINFGRSNTMNTSGTGTCGVVIGESNTLTATGSTDVLAVIIGQANNITGRGIIFGESNSGGGSGIIFGSSNSVDADSNANNTLLIGSSNTINNAATGSIRVFGDSNNVTNSGVAPISDVYGSSIILTTGAGGLASMHGRSYTWANGTAKMFVFDMKDSSATAASGLFFRPNNDASTTRGNNLAIGVSPEVANVGTNNIILRTANAPTATISDTFTLYSSDIIAGNAAPHIRTENGAVIKIYQETTAVAVATYAAVGGTTIQTNDTFDGYTLTQVVKALRNYGLLQ